MCKILISPFEIIVAASPRRYGRVPNEFGSTTSRVAATKTNLNAARARELDSAERKATADQLIAASAVIPIAPPDDGRREALSLSSSPSFLLSLLSLRESTSSATRFARPCCSLSLKRARVDAYVHLRIIVMRSTRNVSVQSIGACSPARSPAPIVKAESRVAYSLEREEPCKTRRLPPPMIIGDT